MSSLLTTCKLLSLLFQQALCALLCSLQALVRINQQQALVEAARTKAVDLKAGMDIFSIPQPPYKELTSMEADLGKLAAIWTIVQEWECSYNTWKKSKFKEIQVWTYDAPQIVFLKLHVSHACKKHEGSLSVSCRFDAQKILPDITVMVCMPFLFSWAGYAKQGFEVNQRVFMPKA
jgi:hypothetical protein